MKLWFVWANGNEEQREIGDKLSHQWVIPVLPPMVNVFAQPPGAPDVDPMAPDINDTIPKHYFTLRHFINPVNSADGYAFVEAGASDRRVFRANELLFCNCPEVLPKDTKCPVHGVRRCPAEWLKR